MNCGIPYCHTGCPVNNQIPDWNDLVYRGDWEEASRNLHSTNNFPEFTGRVCPAPCEAVLHAQSHRRSRSPSRRSNAPSSTGRCAEGWMKPEPPATKTGKTVAVVGSGPAGLACAQQLARAGHDVHVFEKNAKPGGLLRYGIPDFKMEKHLIDRRVEQMKAEGVTFHCGVHVGIDIRRRARSSPTTTRWCSPAAPRSRAICRSPGRELAGVHFAMDFLPQQNRRVARRTDPYATSRSSPPASMSSSSAAATRARTASAPRSARARSR